VVEDVEEGIMASIHPSVLSQLLIVMLEKLSSNGVTRQIVVGGGHFRHWSQIWVEVRPAAAESLAASDFVTETVAVHGGRVALSSHGDSARIELHFPTSEKYVVLVVDDNLDLVHFYKRFVEGTEYEIVHVSQGSEVWQAAATRSPDMIVLDVMLPDMNGWHLLREMQKSPVTQQIPVIVCSVINQEELAKTLGATAYLAKPVHRQQFLQALDRLRLRR
jgi:CheY-like chemotaxis protein